MKRAVPLSEFMPYGAPELLESRQRHLSQALLLASATAIVLYALTGGLASLYHGKATPPVPLVFDVTLAPPPPIVNVEPPTPSVHIPPHAPPVAVPVPVPDVAAPPTDAPTTPSSDATGPGTPGPAGPIDVALHPAVAEALPAFGTQVYVEELPGVVKEVKPTYPDLARSASVEGLVMVHVLIGTDGRVREARVEPKIHVPMLDEAALDAARQWVFTPGLAQGHPVACWTAIPFRFRLR